MKVTSEMVKQLQQRVDVTYEEAERALLRTRGNIDRAEVFLKQQENSSANRLKSEISRIYQELLTYFLKITWKEKVVVNLPLIVVVGLFMVMTLDSKIWIGVISMGMILISESTVTIYRAKKEKEDVVPRSKDEVPVKDGVTVSEEIKTNVMGSTENKNQPKKEKSDGDDYYEITIEK